MRTTYVRAGIVHVIHKGRFFGKPVDSTNVKAGAKVEVSEPNEKGLVTITGDGISSPELWASVELPRRAKKGRPATTDGKQQNAA